MPLNLVSGFFFFGLSLTSVHMDDAEPAVMTMKRKAREAFSGSPRDRRYWTQNTTPKRALNIRPRCTAIIHFL